MAVTFSLLSADVGEVEDGEEAFLLLEVGAVVHLIGAVAGGEREARGGRAALVLHGGRRGAPLPQHSPAFAAFLAQQFFLLLLRGEAEELQELQLLGRRRGEQSRVTPRPLPNPTLTSISIPHPHVHPYPVSTLT